jgi:transcriptional regulator with XRE-family HTH domain
MPREPLKDSNNQRHLELCTLLRELRVNSGYTQAQVAKEIKLSRTSISAIERQGFFRIQHLYLLADFYEIPINELFAEII